VLITLTNTHTCSFITGGFEVDQASFALHKYMMITPNHFLVLKIVSEMISEIIYFITYPRIEVRVTSRTEDKTTWSFMCLTITLRAVLPHFIHTRSPVAVLLVPTQKSSKGSRITE